MNPFEQIEIKKADITKLSVNAIVNAANSGLLGGGGVDGAIHRAAGPELLKECRHLRQTILPKGLPTGQAVATSAYNLPCEYVIHTVGPVWKKGSEKQAELLADCYRNALKICVEKELQSVAFPAISTGVYHYPKQEAVKIAVNTSIRWLQDNNSNIRIIFTLVNDNYEVYVNYLESIK
jgi:O-acetyl-ADP-ribose deacetylase (regulator of RNase III)